jgi:hypothetical protein
VQEKKKFDIGIWSSAPMEDSQNIVSKMLGRYLSQLLFVKVTDRENEIVPSDFKDTNKIRPVPLSKNLANIWAKYPQYNETNTLMISNYYNEIEDFQRNDIVIPDFHPKTGKTDFLDDMHLSYVHQYLRFLVSLDSMVGEDIRMRMEGYGYEAYCQRVNKSFKYDSNKNSDSDYF